MSKRERAARTAVLRSLVRRAIRASAGAEPKELERLAAAVRAAVTRMKALEAPAGRN